MAYRISVRKEAQADIYHAFSYYSQISSSLGGDFLASIDEVMSRISDGPLHYQIVYRDIRRALCRRYPYAVFYQVHENILLVFGVFHIHKNPQEWQDRSP